jgi:hypothetical protein
MSRTAVLDYMGSMDEALAAGTPMYFLALSLVLIGLAIAGWQRST